MSGVVIVAIPQETSNAWIVSSEKVPHMTLLYLGDNPKNLDEIKEFVAYAASKSLMYPFSMNVDRRGELGDDKADVVFFHKTGADSERIENFRSYLLGNAAIRAAYDSQTQFPEWTPHLTLGYPESPAKVPDDLYSREVSWVMFNKIAVWDEDYDGPETVLNYRDFAEVAMSEQTNEFLEHFGVKGMRWGVRRDRTPTSVSVSTRPGKRVKTSGGRNQGPHEDAIRVSTSRQIAKKSSTDALSTKELRELVDRMNLEQNYARLTTKPSVMKTGLQYTKTAIDVASTGQKAYKLATGPMGKAVKVAVEAKLKKG